MENEIWKYIDGYIGYYEVSNLGRVRTKRRLLKLKTGHHGYKYVELWKFGKVKRAKVHRLVLIAFIGPPKGDQICRHFPDPNPANNKLNNLQWGTQFDNQGIDRVIHKTSNRGERCGTSKLTKNEALMIKNAQLSNWNDVKVLAKSLNISTTTIVDIRKQKTWAHL